MKKTVYSIILLSVLLLSTLSFSSCALNEISLDVLSVKSYDEYPDKDVKIFHTGEELKVFFSNEELYRPRNGFNDIIDDKIKSNFFDKKAILVLTLSGISSDTEVKAKNKTRDKTIEITFTILPGMREDITARFFFFEISQDLNKECKFNFDVSYNK